MQHLGDPLTDAPHFGLFHAARGDGGRPDADAAGGHGRVGIKRDGVLVDGNSRALEVLLSLLAGDSL